jgi:hypothetical protein
MKEVRSMFLARLKDIIKGSYKIIYRGEVVEEGVEFKVNGLNGWYEVETIEAKDGYTIITAK